VTRGSIADLQRAFADALLAGDDDRCPSPGYRIHARNVRISLARAIADTFPATAHVLGAVSFAALAQTFVGAHPPAKGWLTAYGADFPQFLSRRALDEVPAPTAEIALLEWIRVEVSRAPIAVPLDLGMLADRGPEGIASSRLALAPCAAFLDVSPEALRLWEKWESGTGAPTRDGSRDERRGRLLVIRTGVQELRHVRLPDGAAAMLQAFEDGAMLVSAAEAAARVDPTFDPAETLLRMSMLGAMSVGDA